MAEQLELPLQGAPVPAEGGPVREQAAVRLESFPVPSQRLSSLLRQPPVDEGPDLGRAGEAQLVVLADDLDQSGRGLLEGGGRRHRRVEVRPAPALPGEAASGHHLLAVLPEEPPLGRGLVAERPDHARRGALTEEQPERTQQQGLAGPGLAGDHGQPGSGLQTGVFEHPEVADEQLVEHRFSPPRTCG